MLLLLSLNNIRVEEVFELAKWEYKVIPIKTQIHSDHSQAERRPVMDDVQSDLNALGNEGWELVSVQDISMPDGRRFTVAYLKRQNLLKKAQ
jgi:hypothetical protein